MFDVEGIIDAIESILFPQPIDDDNHQSPEPPHVPMPGRPGYNVMWKEEMDDRLLRLRRRGLKFREILEQV